MRTRKPNTNAPPPLRRQVIRAAAKFMQRFGRFNQELYSPEDNLHIYDANIELASDAIFPTFISTRLPYTDNWPKFRLEARDKRPSLNQKRASFLGYVALQRTEGSNIPGHIQRIWEVRYKIDSFRNRCRIDRSVTGKIISHAYEVGQLPGVDAVRDGFPPKLAITEAHQLIRLLEDPMGMELHLPRDAIDFY